MNSTSAQLREYRRNRLFVAGIVVVGVIVSIAVNQLDSHTWINKAIAGWPPIGLLLTLEALVRIPTNGKRLSTISRIAATVAVASGAGWLSYWHMVAAVSQHGESYISAHIWPATVDGLMTITAIGMVELGARIRTLRSQPQRVDDAATAAAQLIQAVNAAEPVAPMEATPVAPIVPEQHMTAQEGVADMMTSPLWSQRLGRPGRRK
jgi:hypothetical protein